MLLKKLILLFLVCCFSIGVSAQDKRLNVVLAGLSHDMVYEVLNSYRNGDINIIGIAEADFQLAEKYRRIYNFPTTIIYSNLADALKAKKPDVIMAYNTTSQHIDVVEIAAPLGIPMMLEKPLCLDNKEAERIAFLADKYKVKVLTNYENSWFAGNHEVYQTVKANDNFGAIVKMTSVDGHAGPKASKVSKEFLNWLNDPAKGGDGVLYDFGCYGANLMTWMMNGLAPISVKAVTSKLKPDIYPNVVDEATIELEYPQAIGIIKASWNLAMPYTGFSVTGQMDSIQTAGKDFVRGRMKGTKKYSIHRAKEQVEAKASYLGYLTAVLKNDLETKNDLSSLENNIIVMKILVAAEESSQSGKKVYLK